MKRNRTDYVAYIFFALLAATALELLINVAPFIVLVGSAAMIYYGLKRMSKQKGKFLFYGGLVIFILTLLSSFFFLLMVFGALFYMLYLFWEKASKPTKMEIAINEQASNDSREAFVKNTFLGDQQLNHEGFRSDDINIHTGIGTTEIHFENTILQKETRLSLSGVLLGVPNSMCLMMQVYLWSTLVYLVRQIYLETIK